MKYSILLVSIGLLSFSACTSPTPQHQKTYTANNTVTTNYEKPTPEKMALYQKTMRSVASGIQNDSRYQRIALDTPEKKAWFRTLTYRLWDRQITRQQFMSEGLAKYPTHKYEFEFVVKGFNSVSA
jgi:hypothetical protein